MKHKAGLAKVGILALAMNVLETWELEMAEKMRCQTRLGVAK